LLVAVLAAPVHADQWSVEKAGFDLYRIVGKNVYLRTDGCEDAPVKGVVEVRKQDGARRMTFADSAASCIVRDFLARVEVESNQYGVLLTRDQTNNWYRVSDRRVSDQDLYAKTTGCISRTISEPAILDLKRGGAGWVRFSDGRRCAVEQVFRRFNP